MYKESDDLSSENVISAMVEEMIGNGFFPDTLEPNGKWHRFRQPGGSKNNMDAAYVLSINGESAQGCYYSYRKQDEKFYFHHGKKQTFIEKFLSYPPADAHHPYLLRKQIPATSFRQDPSGRLVVPMVDQTGQCCGLQLISSDGAKTLMKGSMKIGSRLDLQGNETAVFICEGVATGFSVNQATGNKVVVSWDESNLKHIAPYVKEVHPNSKIIFAADNDTTSTPNIGVQSAKRAAASIGATVVIPEMNGNKCDWNDVHCLLGIDEVKRQIEAGIDEKSTGFAPLTPQQTRVSGRLFSPPPTAEYILNIFGRPLIKRGIVFAIVGAGGSGKSFLTKKILTIMASGESWGPFSVPRKMNVLYLSGEDEGDDLDRRLWDIQPDGKFPDGLHVASVVGQVGALMEFGANGNPQVTKWRDWLLKTIQAHPGLDVLVIDPLSKFFGLAENSNENANAFIAMLQTLCVEIGGTGLNICYVHHANKASMTEAGIGKSSSRGASAFRDGVRFEMTLKDIDASDAKRYGIDGNTRSYFKMDVTKTNFAGEISDPIFFMKNATTGVPEHVDLKKDRLVEVSESFYDSFFLHNTPEKRRDLLRGKPVDLFDTIKSENQDFKVKDMPAVLDYLLKEGAIEEEYNTNRGQLIPVIKVSIDPFTA